MFERVDAALGSFLRSGLPKAVTVSFDSPEPAAGTGGKGSRVLASLHSIQEDLSGRAQGVQGIRNSDGRVTARRAFPRRYALSYAITATAATVHDEHAVLGAVAYLLSQHDVLPPSHADQELVEAGDLNLMLGPPLPPPADAMIAPRLALNLVVVAPMAAPLISDLPKAPDNVELATAQRERGRTPAPASGVPDG